MTIDLLRTQVKDMLTAWLDSEGEERAALLHLLAVQLRPTRMADSENSVKSKITAGPAPWDDPIAHLLADVSSGSRTIERGMDIALGFNIRIRGGSDGNTRHALSRIPDLAEALADRLEYAELVAEARMTIGLWHRAALLLLGAERRWAHIRTEVEVRDENDVLADVYPGIAACPYCESPVRIQPDLADGGYKGRWACPECTEAADCAQCTHRAAWAAVDTAETVSPRPLTYDEKAFIWTSTPPVFGCEHVTVFGCAHARARHHDIGKAIAVCVDPGCVDDDGRRRTWPVDEWLGQLLMWKRDTRQLRSA